VQVDGGEVCVCLCAYVLVVGYHMERIGKAVGEREVGLAVQLQLDNEHL